MTPPLALTRAELTRIGVIHFLRILATTMIAGLVAFTVGRTSEVTAVLTMIAGLWLITHLLLGAALSAVELVPMERKR